LLEDVLRESEQRVPILGSIPILGALFRTQQSDLVKTNLMVFIRPKILRDTAQTRFETNAKYNAIRESLGTDRIKLMPGTERFSLPPYETLETEREQGSDSRSDDEGAE